MRTERVTTSLSESENMLNEVPKAIEIYIVHLLLRVITLIHQPLSIIIY